MPERVYAHLVADGAAVERGIGEGWLVADTRLRDFLGQCPDPLAAIAARAGLRSLASPRLGEEELRSEWAAIGLDVMHGAGARAGREHGGRAANPPAQGAQAPTGAGAEGVAGTAAGGGAGPSPRGATRARPVPPPGGGGGQPVAAAAGTGGAHRRAPGRWAPAPQALRTFVGSGLQARLARGCCATLPGRARPPVLRRPGLPAPCAFSSARSSSTRATSTAASARARAARPRGRHVAFSRRARAARAGPRACLPDADGCAWAPSTSTPRPRGSSATYDTAVAARRLPHRLALPGALGALVRGAHRAPLPRAGARSSTSSSPTWWCPRSAARRCAPPRT